MAKSGSGSPRPTKLGRKGDERMHRAVAARLENPQLSLYQALIQGGFFYESDDNPNAMDSEQVSLAQRKNQLSRRVRLAKKQRSNDGGLSDDPALTITPRSRSNIPDEVPSCFARDHPDYKPIYPKRSVCVEAPEVNKRTRTSSRVAGRSVVPAAPTASRPFAMQPRDSEDIPMAHDPQVLDAESSALPPAVASLENTAREAGLTIDELADSLAQSKTSIGRFLRESKMSKMEQAFSRYSEERQFLVSKCMLVAGYPPEIAYNSHHSQFKAFAREAWRREGQAFSTLCEGGRHLHRLDGRCGHQPVIHNPTTGRSHIDFIVGDRVECYEEVQPVATEDAANVRLWPSNFKCEAVSCPLPCTEEILQNKGNPQATMVGEPKLFDVNDLDLTGPEWNLDFSSGDSVLGLFKLGTDADEGHAHSGHAHETSGLAHSE